MKVCTMLVSCGVLLAAVISAKAHPVADATTAGPTSVEPTDKTSSAPHVSPLSTSASSPSATKTNPSGSLDSPESESKESDERKSSTTAKSLFRRQAEDQSEDDGDEGGDDESDGDDEADTDDTRTKRQLSSSQSEQKGVLLGQGEKPEDQKKDDHQSPEKSPPFNGARVS